MGVALSAFAAAPKRKPPQFQVLPRDESLQPLPPEKAGNIEFIGNRKFTADKLREPIAEQIRDINEGGLTRPRADDTAYYVAVFYRKQGYHNVEVDWDIRGRYLILRIDEGRQTTLRNVTFTGNRAITDPMLYEYMIGATKERLLKEPAAFPFVEADIKTGVARIRGLYESEGYIEAVIDEPKIDFPGDRTKADVVVNISEGQRYTFGAAKFEGNLIFPEAEVRSGLGERFNAPYTTQQLATMERNLEFFYKSRGYYQAAVAIAADPKQAEKGRVPVTITVNPHRLFRFNGVKVQGLDRLRASFLPQRFASLEGQIYSPEKLDEKYRELLRTGLFKNLRINSVPQDDDTLRLDLTVEEAKAKELGFSIGGGSYEGLILGLRAADRNFFGTGRPLSFTLGFSARGTRGEFLWIDPWLFNSEFNLRTRLYVQGREEVGYLKRETGVRTDLARKMTKNIELAVFAQLENVEITEAFIEPQFLGATSYQIGTLGFTQSFDFRDNPINPSKGWILNSGFDFNALAGELAFGRATLRLSYYHPLSRRVLLALGARGGMIFPVSDVPIDERYFSGGSTTVRSFPERELGPKDKQGLAIGGEVFTVFNAEVIFPLFGALQGAVFVDAGNLIAKSAEAGVQDMRYAVGAGLRYKLPIGPLRLDYGVNPTPRSDEEFGAFHFSFGFAF